MPHDGSHATNERNTQPEALAQQGRESPECCARRTRTKLETLCVITS